MSDLLPPLDKSLHHHQHHKGIWRDMLPLFLQNTCICSSSSHAHAHLGSLTRSMVIPILQISEGSEKAWFPGGTQWGQGTQPQDPAFYPLPKTTLSISIYSVTLGTDPQVKVIWPWDYASSFLIPVRIYIRGTEISYIGTLEFPHRHARPRCCIPALQHGPWPSLTKKADVHFCFSKPFLGINIFSFLTSFF